ncbi:MAG: hypothetical protein AAB965_04110 [Patescibacteria group bacterium]
MDKFSYDDIEQYFNIRDWISRELYLGDLLERKNIKLPKTPEKFEELFASCE